MLQNGTTPLIMACDQGYLDIVKVLIDHGADVNDNDKVIFDFMVL